jgi:hypothetical protein
MGGQIRASDTVEKVVHFLGFGDDFSVHRKIVVSLLEGTDILIDGKFSIETGKPSRLNLCVRGLYKKFDGSGTFCLLVKC